MNTFPQSLALLIAFWFDGVLHGIYLVLFLRWFFLKKPMTSIYFKIICWAGFVSSNLDFGINLYLMLQGFWFWLPKGGPDAFFANLSNWQTVLREVNYQVLVSVCDAFMVYRLWRIWGGNWYITILPILLLICETAFGLMAPICLGLRSKLLPTAINVFLGFNTALQVTITAIISFRLLDPRQIKFLPQRQRTLRFQLVRCIVESGLLVTVAIVIDLALFAQGILFHWVFNIGLIQLYAITTVLIVLRMSSLTGDGGSSFDSRGYSSNTSGSQGEYPRAPRPDITKTVAVSLYRDPPDKMAPSDSYPINTLSAMPKAPYCESFAV